MKPYERQVNGIPFVQPLRANTITDPADSHLCCSHRIATMSAGTKARDRARGNDSTIHCTKEDVGSQDSFCCSHNSLSPANVHDLSEGPAAASRKRFLSTVDVASCRTRQQMVQELLQRACRESHVLVCSSIVDKQYSVSHDFSAREDAAFIWSVKLIVHFGLDNPIRRSVQHRGDTAYVVSNGSPCRSLLIRHQGPVPHTIRVNSRVRISASGQPRWTLTCLIPMEHV